MLINKMQQLINTTSIISIRKPIYFFMNTNMPAVTITDIRLIIDVTAIFAHAIIEVFEGAVFKMANSLPSILNAAAVLELCVPNKLKVIIKLNAIVMMFPSELVLITDIMKLKINDITGNKNTTVIIDVIDSNERK